METKKFEQIYQEVANLLVAMIPEDWKKVLLYAEVREGYSTVFFYYYPQMSNSPIYSLNIPDIFNVSVDQFENLENNLYRCFKNLLQEFRNQEQDLWTSLTFILEHTGAMKIDYSFEDISQLSPVDKQEEWEKKYIMA